MSSSHAQKLQSEVGREESERRKARLCYTRRSRRMQKIHWLHDMSWQLVSSRKPASHFDGRRREQGQKVRAL